LGNTAVDGELLLLILFDSIGDTLQQLLYSFAVFSLLKCAGLLQ
jgi:hypothetical protein